MKRKIEQYEEAVRLAEKHGARAARAPEPYPSAVVMEPAQLAALIAEVRRDEREKFIDRSDPTLKWEYHPNGERRLITPEAK